MSRYCSCTQVRRCLSRSLGYLYNARHVVSLLPFSPAIHLTRWQPFKRIASAHALVPSTRLDTLARRHSSGEGSAPKATEIALGKNDGEHVDREFHENSGFWPASEISDIGKRESLDLGEQLGAEEDIIENEVFMNTNLPLFPPKTKVRKVDLSYINVAKREAGKLVYKLSLATPDTSTFRADRGLRRSLADYMTRLAPWVEKHLTRTTLTPPEESTYFSALRTFRTTAKDELHSRGYVETDLVNWSWILTSRNSAQAVKRYTTLASELRQRGERGLPLFIPLQLLRVKSIDAEGLQAMMGELSYAQPVNGGALKSLDNDMAWDSTSATLLVFRLLRHARLVSVDLYDAIIGLAIKLLNPASLANQETKTSGNHKQRLTQVFNRLLSLLALPTSQNPFRSIVSQQRAQVSLMRHMLVSKPVLPVTREGYRALVKVQLAHKKTESEQSWAHAKSLSWPPWRQDKLGIEEDIEYPGKDSRATKMLRRMTEAGYSHGSWDRIASVYAGWDTDKSPTIQTRQILVGQPMAWLKDRFSKPNDPFERADHEMWTARITATRTVKEAWACFCSYAELTAPEELKSGPYYAMLLRLLARPQKTGTESRVVPGDAKETFAEPNSTREIVYVPRDPPSLEQFYKEMLSHNIRPAGRLLRDLVDHAKSLQEGFGYLADSYYDEVKKDVLLHAEKYDADFIRQTLSRIPDYFFAAFIGLLMRNPTTTTHHASWLRAPCSASSSKNSKSSSQPVAPSSYAIRLLGISQTTYLPAWNAAVATMRWSKKGEIHPKWLSVRRTLRRMVESGVRPDAHTLHGITHLAIEVSLLPSLTGMEAHDVLSTIKLLFPHVAYGHTCKNPDDWLEYAPSRLITCMPEPETLFRLVILLGIHQDLNGISGLLVWINEHADLVERVQDETNFGYTWIQRTLACSRAFLEGSWASNGTEGVRSATGEHIQQAAGVCQAFRWPSTEEVEDVVNSKSTLFGRIGRVVEARTKREGVAASGGDK